MPVQPVCSRLNSTCCRPSGGRGGRCEIARGCPAGRKLILSFLTATPDPLSNILNNRATVKRTL
jgi:hypothetical protein